MALSRDYEITEASTELRSAFDGLLESKTVPVVGVYNYGLLSLIDYSLGSTLLKDWIPSVGAKNRALATTAFGDVFYWQPAVGIQFLEVQAVQSVFICKSAEEFVDGFLASSPVRENILRQKQFELVQNAKGPLGYHDAFILKPCRMLGGVEKPSNYDIGSCSVYLSLVGQTLRNNGLLH